MQSPTTENEESQQEARDAKAPLDISSRSRPSHRKEQAKEEAKTSRHKHRIPVYTLHEFNPPADGASLYRTSFKLRS